MAFHFCSHFNVYVRFNASRMRRVVSTFDTLLFTGLLYSLPPLHHLSRLPFSGLNGESFMSSDESDDENYNPMDDPDLTKDAVEGEDDELLDDEEEDLDSEDDDDDLLEEEEEDMEMEDDEESEEEEVVPGG